jgi:hypothetical protein
VGIGDFCGSYHFFHGGIVHPEGDVVVETIVEEDSFLVHIAYQASQVLYSQVFDVLSVYQDFARLHIVETGHKVDQC